MFDENKPASESDDDQAVKLPSGIQLVDTASIFVCCLREYAGLKMGGCWFAFSSIMASYICQIGQRLKEADLQRRNGFGINNCWQTAPFIFEDGGFQYKEQGIYVQ